MANIDTGPNLVDSPAGVDYFPQFGSIDDLSILFADGSKQNIKGILHEISYYEDIFSFVVSGHLRLKDASGIVERFGLTGKEFLTIDFGRSKGDPRPAQTFRLYSIPKRDPIGNLSSEFLDLHFCSEELLLSEQIKIVQSFKGMEISTMIKNILKDYLRVGDTKNSFIQNTIGKYDFIIPAKKPLEAISWLSTYALPSVNGGADMLFFETVWGFYFKSLGTLYEQEPIAIYKYDQQSITGKSFNESSVSVLDFEFIKTFDSLDEIKSGSFANRVISLDPLTRTRTVTDFDYNKYKNNASKLNPGTLLSSSTNRLGLTQNQAYAGSLRMVTSNSNQKRKIPGVAGVSVSEDIFIEKTLPNRTAQIALINHTKLKLKIPGNSLLSAGDTINFDLLSYIGGENRKLDTLYSGKYLVTAIRHNITGDGKYVCLVEISKESTPVQA
jgi:hypothetical protein